MSWNPNSAKHKAMHGGYRQKPTQEQVKATLSFFGSVDLKQNNKSNKVHNQLNLFNKKFGRTK
jgi:hypothetical protein